MKFEPLIFDTTVWIEFLGGKDTTGSNLLRTYLENDFPVVLIPTIIQEVLQGIRGDSDYSRIKSNLTGFSVLEIEAVEAAIGAAELYRNLRKKGITIRKSNDCLIAFYSIFYKIPIVHNDSDFDLIAQHAQLLVRRI